MPRETLYWNADVIKAELPLASERRCVSGQTPGACRLNVEKCDIKFEPWGHA